MSYQGVCPWCGRKTELIEHKTYSYFLRSMTVPQLLCAECVGELKKQIFLSEKLFFETQFRYRKNVSRFDKL